VLFPDVYDRYGGLVYETRTMKVTGRVEPSGQIELRIPRRAKTGETLMHFYPRTTRREKTSRTRRRTPCRQRRRMARQKSRAKSSAFGNGSIRGIENRCASWQKRWPPINRMRGWRMQLARKSLSFLAMSSAWRGAPPRFWRR